MRENAFPALATAVAIGLSAVTGWCLPHITYQKFWLRFKLFDARATFAFMLMHAFAYCMFAALHQIKYTLVLRRAKTNPTVKGI